MARLLLSLSEAAETVLNWRAPKILYLAAARSSALLGHDLIHRFRAERYQLFIAGLLAMWSSSCVILPLLEYLFALRSLWFLGLVAVGLAQCAVLTVAWLLARRELYEHSITLVCVGTWISSLVVVYISPPLFPVMVLVVLVPVAFAGPYIHLHRGFVVTLATAACVLAMVAIARFTTPSYAVYQAPRWIETAFIVVAVPVVVLHLMVIAWNNASALWTSEEALAERAAELAASRSRLATAADEERRRIERDLHDGAQQHLVALSVLIGLARNAEPEQCRSLLSEASDLVDTSVDEIRRLAHGIYPALLVTGGLTEALPTLATRAGVPVQVNLRGLGRYPAAVEGALYYCCSEALQNAAKHGGPDTTVTITGGCDDGTLTLTVADTGPGFDPGTIGHGLINMADRLSAIGGNLQIDTARGRGTRITAVVETALRTPESDVLVV